ncbi:MAG: hypothetical protein ABIB43_05075 [archaeon]
MKINVKKITNPTESELEDIIQLQKDGWDLKGDSLVDKDVLKVMAKHGLVLGAYGDNESIKEKYNGDLVGFSLSYNSWDENLLNALENTPNVPSHIRDSIKSLGKYYYEFEHYSHMLATRKNLRGQNIGLQLKKAQGKEVLKQGLRFMTWTYDPLFSRNANLNINSLDGFVSGEKGYQPDAYGSDVEGNYDEFPTDRFWVKWNLRNYNSEKSATNLQQYLSDGGKVITETENETINDGKGNTFNFRKFKSINTGNREKYLLLEIPTNIDDDTLIDYDGDDDRGENKNDLRLPWRMALRDAFQNSFFKKDNDINYKVVDFVTKKTDNKDAYGMRAFYVLERMITKTHERCEDF